MFQLPRYMADIRNHYALMAVLQFYVEHTYNSMLTIIGCLPYEGGTVQPGAVPGFMHCPV